ncbi:hypothetical protein BZJ19_10680 [Salinivibrio proteolyticus]|uniref:DUF2066 domain-containing protein n=1 Tax=Salinivibrio proteolyticus TaxID=334715 RepID=A0ABY7LE14_9GAMM|nr:DUF2066 domain-containing protein [Salinivibrio proteolyticus]OOF24920.1 hypothetical protein BZJ19_10680 [Salinivibrio proteolyticus]WBA15482.1 DUF2066 domain-containing protein [Salinivibrio proteolyticus]
MIRFVMAVMAMLWLPSVFANNLYHASVPLDNGAQTSQQAAKQQGLLDVLVKVSGQRDIADNPSVQNRLNDVDGLITQVGYGETARTENSESVRTLEVGFDSQQVQALLRDAGLPLWGTPRPSVLVWLVDDRGAEREIVWEQSDVALVDALRDSAAKRGLPVLVPVGDFDDLMAISASDLWGGFIGPVSDASQRYQADGIVIAKLTPQGIRWQFFPDASDLQSDQQRGQGDSAAMINAVADYYATRTAVVFDQDDDSQAVTLAIAGVQGGDDYVQLERTLAGLNALQSAHLAELEGDTLRFTVRLAASQQALINELTANREIRLMTPQERLDYAGSEKMETSPQQPAGSALDSSDEGVRLNNEPTLEGDVLAEDDTTLWFVWQSS